VGVYSFINILDRQIPILVMVLGRQEMIIEMISMMAVNMMGMMAKWAMMAMMMMMMMMMKEMEMEMVDGDG
jgi:hypothetical protein